ncbi:MAG: flagellar export protein FliJ, partial [Brevundimonas sp.]|nr:flagellar export protein FliJ [Brevundimonas sp.]
MTAWAQSLIRISNYEVETLQKRLAEVSARRATAEMRLAVLDAEVEVERERARLDADANMMLAAYLNGWKARRAA